MRRTPSSARLFALAAPLVLALTTSAGLGCRGGDAEDEAAIEERLDETGTLDVVEWAAQAEYEPPEDGKLSERQMEMYVAVQRRAAKIRQVARQRMEERTGDEQGEKEIGFAAAMRAVGDLGDMMTAELRAARELDENPAEYQWVVGQIAGAQVAAVGNQARQGFARASGEMLEALAEQLEETDDADRREALREQIAELRENLAEQEEASVSAAPAHNLELYQRYREEIEEASRDDQESLDGAG